MPAAITTWASLVPEGRQVVARGVSPWIPKENRQSPVGATGMPRAPAALRGLWADEAPFPGAYAPGYILPPLRGSVPTLPANSTN